MVPPAEQPDERRAARAAAPEPGRFDFERGWMAVACLLLFVAAALLYLGRTNAAFFAAALGVSAWFLNVRTQLKRKHDLVKRGGRNWVPRGSVEDAED